MLKKLSKQSRTVGIAMGIGLILGDSVARELERHVQSSCFWCFTIPIVLVVVAPLGVMEKPWVGADPIASAMHTTCSNRNSLRNRFALELPVVVVLETMILFKY